MPINKKTRVEAEEFDNILKKGKRLDSPFFTLRVLGGKTSGNSYAFVVSKKIAKKATERNFLKRRGYNALRKVEKTLKKGYFIVFFIKDRCIRADFKEIVEDLESLLKKAYLS